MPTYTPLDAGVNFGPDEVRLADVRWRLNGLLVRWVLPRERTLFVRFTTQTIIRIMDEFPMGEELDHIDKSQLFPDGEAFGFAFEVTGGAFPDAQPKLFGLGLPPLKHYQFLTGSACMDILTLRPPRFRVVGPRM